MENAEKNCCVCGSTDSLIQVQEKWICEKCLYIGHNKLISPWKDPLEILVIEFSDACNSCLLSEDPEDVHQAKNLGKRIQSVLGFLKVPKKHVLSITIKKVTILLNEVWETEILLDELKTLSEENSVYAELVKLVSEKQKKMLDHLRTKLPILIDDSYYQASDRFLNKELSAYILPFETEKALQKDEERFNKLILSYYQCAEEKGNTSAAVIKDLHRLRNKAKSLKYIYIYLNEVFGKQYKEKVIDYQNIQRNLSEVDDLKIWISHFKSYEKKVNAPKKEIKAVKKNQKRRLNHVLETVELPEEHLDKADENIETPLDITSAESPK